jgi:probable F420-dependent oxidoreductase
MKLGIALRLAGQGSEPGTLRECAQAADRAGIDDLWVPDHIAIPPDDAEGSNGRYLDPLASLAYLAACTEQIGLGTGVLILPYRSPLPTAKRIATIQELSGGRLRLGVGIGWMKSEFRALGLDRSQRGAASDRMLELLRRCFESQDDIVVENGQPFYFRPNPPPPPIFVGGGPPHAIDRVIRYADGWMPMMLSAAELKPHIDELHEKAAAAGKPVPEVVTFGGLPAQDPGRGEATIREFEAAGVTRFVLGGRYADGDEFGHMLERLVRVRERLE